MLRAPPLRRHILTDERHTLTLTQRQERSLNRSGRPRWRNLRGWATRVRQLKPTPATLPTLHQPLLRGQETVTIDHSNRLLSSGVVQRGVWTALRAASAAPSSVSGVGAPLVTPDTV
jgi:DNA-binding transcriptional regulator/RsmH inhibitor MraZ